MKLARSLAALLAFPALAQEAPESPWLTDHELARSRARNERRDLLMVFLGPAAAGGNAAIERDVLGSKDFTNDALQRFVLARFDYPEPASKLPDALQRENERLLRKYESPELPVVWLEDQSGTVYARLGYVPVGGKPFLAMLDSRREAAKQASATLARAAGLSGIARAQALAEGLRHLDDHVVALAHYREMLEIIQTDADGAAGLKAEFDAIARDAAMRPLRTRMQSELEPRIAEQAWDDLDAGIVAASAAHAGQRWAEQYLALLRGIRTADGDGDAAAAAAIFASALALAPRSELAPRIEFRRQQALEAAAAAARRAAAEAEAAGKQQKKAGKKAKR